MKAAIHPDYTAAKILCNCGNVIETRSTRGDFHIEICANCHPFFTGKQKIMDTAGRIEKFRTRYGSAPAQPAAKDEPKAAAPVSKKAEAPKENRAAKRAKSGKSKPRTEDAPPAADAAAPAGSAEAAEAKPE
jgi:large subunit ribosomal protein L31